MRAKTLVKSGLLFLLVGQGAVTAQEAMSATGFVWPVLKEGITDARKNREDPRVASSDACAPGRWYSSGNGFGNRYCDHGLRGCTAADCYHPGEDWNGCSGDIGETVFAVANGTVVGSGIIGDNNRYITIEHRLPSPKDLEYYILVGTRIEREEGEAPPTFDVVYSSYLHISDPLVANGDVVTKGQAIAKISACCNHLHLELKVRGTSASNCGCGYCSSTQQLTDVGYIDPTRFIADHLEDLYALPVGTSAESQVEIIAPSSALGTDQGTVSAEVCPSGPDSCRPIDVQITDWVEERAALTLAEEIEDPVSLELRQSGDLFVGTVTYPFVDVGHDWFGRSVVDLWKRGAVQAKGGAAEFWPEDEVTRAEFVQMLVLAWKAECIEQACPEDPPFDDVDEDQWFYEIVKAAFNEGWIMPKPSFRPNEKLNRAEAATLLLSAINPSSDNLQYKQFADVSSSDWFYDEVGIMSGHTIINGYAEGKDCNGADAPGQTFFCPAHTLLRAEAVKMISSGLALYAAEQLEEEGGN